MSRKTKAPPDTQVRETTAWLIVPLTPAEIKKRQGTLADAVVKRAQAMAKIQSLKNELQNELAAANTDIKAATRELAMGKEARVKVQETKDFRNKRLTLKRMDTGDTYEDRAMEEWEMQPDLEGEDGDAQE
jgi:hypothetical protein